MKAATPLVQRGSASKNQTQSDTEGGYTSFMQQKVKIYPIKVLAAMDAHGRT